jgi:hypothetical protein
MPPQRYPQQALFAITISSMLDVMYDCIVAAYNKENEIQKPHSDNANPVGKPVNDTENDTQICISEDERSNLNSGKAAVHDVGSRSVVLKVMPQ